MSTQMTSSVLLVTNVITLVWAGDTLVNGYPIWGAAVVVALILVGTSLRGLTTSVHVVGTTQSSLGGHKVCAPCETHYNGRRPHRSRQLRPPRPGPARPPHPDMSRKRIKRRPVLSGLISEYERAA